MKIYLVVSALLHLLVAYSAVLNAPISTNQPQAEETTVDLVEDTKKGEAGTDAEIIEMSQGPGQQIREIKDFFWGIGIMGEYVDFNGGHAYKVIHVAQGYSAESAGILLNDLIYSVNGKDPLVNDIAGHEPAHLMLGIVRGSKFLIIQLDRTKIYY